MRVMIATWGSRGDYQPYLALAAAFQARGHEVRVGAPPTPGFPELAAQHGIAFEPLGPAVESSVMVDTANAAIHTADPVQGVRIILERLLLPAMSQMFTRCVEMARWSDVVVSHFLQVAGAMAAEVGGRPLVTGTLVPTQLPTATRAPGIAGDLGRAVNQARWRAALSHMNACLLPLVNEARAHASLPALDDVASDGFYSRGLNLVAISEEVFPRPSDWTDRHRITGYWLLDAPPAWQPPPAVEAFLARGGPVIGIGFGSMTTPDSAALTRVVLDGVRQAGVRALIEPGMARVAEGLRTPDALVVTDIPHAWLLPRVDAFVHHGGSGTTAAVLHAGVPSVVVPHVFDQHIWGARLQQLGVAPAPLPLASLNAEHLGGAIAEAVRNTRMRRNARRLGARLRGERGAAHAVRLVERYVAAARGAPTAAAPR